MACISKTIRIPERFELDLSTQPERMRRAEQLRENGGSPFEGIREYLSEKKYCHLDLGMSGLAQYIEDKFHGGMPTPEEIDDLLEKKSGLGVRITNMFQSNEGTIMGQGTLIEDSRSGLMIPGVTNIDLNISAGGLTTATISLHPKQFEIVAHGFLECEQDPLKKKILGKHQRYWLFGGEGTPKGGKRDLLETHEDLGILRERTRTSYIFVNLEWWQLYDCLEDTIIEESGLDPA